MLAGYCHPSLMQIATVMVKVSLPFMITFTAVLSPQTGRKSNLAPDWYCCAVDRVRDAGSHTANTPLFACTYRPSDKHYNSTMQPSCLPTKNAAQNWSALVAGI